MKKSIRIVLIVLALIAIGGLSSLLVNYIVFSKLVNHPTWSKNPIVEALSNKVVVTERIEKVVVKDNESLADITAQVSVGVVYVEEVLSPISSAMPSKGSGIVMSSDGIIAIHESIVANNVEDYKVSFFDGSTHSAKKVFKDDFSGMIFLRVEERGNLTAMPFANSSDAISGRKLINIYREQMSEETFYALGILSGYDHLLQSQQPSCDYLEGAFRVDFNESALKRGLGGPMIDFNSEMVGMLVKNYKGNYFMIASNDVKMAFNRFLNSSVDNSEEVSGGEETGAEVETEAETVENNKSTEVKSRVVLGTSCSSLSEVEGSESGGVQINYSVEGVDGKKTVVSNVASELGIEDGDVITQVGEYKVNAKNPLPRVLLDYKKGDTAKIKLLRNDKEVELDVTF